MTSVPLSVRLADADDLPALHPLIERAYRGESARAGWTHEADLLDGQRTDPATLHDIIADDMTRLLIAEAGDVLVGCVQIADRGDGLGYLGLLCVDPRLQAGGIGKMLLDEAESLAAATFGTTVMEMTVIDRRPELIGYYERRGYLPTGERRDFPIAVEPPLHMTVLAKRLG